MSLKRKKVQKTRQMAKSNVYFFKSSIHGSNLVPTWNAMFYKLMSKKKVQRLKDTENFRVYLSESKNALLLFRLCIKMTNM